MNLPNFFLADQPPEAALTEQIVREGCLTLKRNRARNLESFATGRLIEVLGLVARSWLEPDNPFRQLALDLSPAQTGFSQKILAKGLDAFFEQVTPAALEALLVQDLGHGNRLEAFVATEAEQHLDRRSMAAGPELLVHVSAGNLPCPAMMSLILGLLARSAQFLKCATGTSSIPRLFGHSIHAAEPKLAACMEIAEWAGGKRPELESVLYAEADALTATGSDQTLAAIRAGLPPKLRFLGYGHQVSFGFIDRDALSRFQLPKLAAAAAQDVVMWDQQGCLSPHVFYVEEGGASNAAVFAEALAGELDRLEPLEPRGPIRAADAALIQTSRDLYHVRASYSDATRLWTSTGSSAWTVVWEADPLFQASILNRFVYVKSAPSLAAVLQSADRVRGHVSTVGLAAPGPRMEELTRALARWGVGRICPIGQMQRPPLCWRHDGRPALAELIRWTDWEGTRGT